MHYLVRLIVEADDADEAVSQAESTMTNLIDWGEFDWYSAKDDESRWKDCWKPSPFERRERSRDSSGCDARPACRV